MGGLTVWLWLPAFESGGPLNKRWRPCSTVLDTGLHCILTDLRTLASATLLSLHLWQHGAATPLIGLLAGGSGAGGFSPWSPPLRIDDKVFSLFHDACHMVQLKISRS